MTKLDWYQMKRYKQIREERIKLGLCTRCGNPREDDATTLCCESCRKNHIKQAKEHRDKLAFEGLCGCCGGELPEEFIIAGRRTCPKCLDIKRYSRKKHKGVVVMKPDGHCHVCGTGIPDGVLCGKCERVEMQAGRGSILSANKRCQELGWVSYHITRKENGLYYIEEVKGY